MPKQLNTAEMEELKSWLYEHQVTTPIHKMCREFSDGVAVAQLLKRIYPRLVDLHNYPSRNNTQLKLINWETLNTKALSKLGLCQTKSMLEKLSKSTPGCIELLLFDIMIQDREQRIKEENKRNELSAEQEQEWSENDDILVVNINKKVGDAIVQVPQKMILFSIYEQTLKESHSKDAFLNAAQQKVAHLEHLLKLKGERIDELCSQLAKLSVRNLLRQHNMGSSNPSSELELCSKVIET